MYKKALNAFFLKVHPDFFHHNRPQQVANENAVAQLNELLTWARDFKAGTLRPPPATTINFTFFRRIEESEPAPAQSQPQPPGERRNGGGSSSSSAAVSVNSTFALPDGFTASEANRGLVERSVNKFLRDLLRRAECIDSVAESVSAAGDATAARLEAKPLRRRPPRRKQQAGEETEARGPASLLDEASEALYTQWSLTPVPTLEELIEADQILFARDLSPLQCAAAVHTLRGSLGELRYETWESMPLLLSDRFAIGTDMSGSLTVPWDFTPAQFLSFLAHNEKAITACRSEAMAFAASIESLISDISRTADLDDILVSCSHKEALPALRLLHRHAEVLHRHGVTNLTLEIGERYATRANGVLVLRHSMHTPEQLREWLALVGPKLELQKKLYAASKQMLESTMWHLKEFRDMAQPGGLDAFQQNDCTYAQRLEWAKELFRIGPSLAQWDWSDFTFMLGDELEISWEGRQMSLPFNFDGDSLVRYVESVQAAARESRKQELLERSALDRVEQERQRQRQHARELNIDGEEKEKEEGEDAEALLAREQLANVYRQTAPPHAEEYMASSEHRNDSLTVERPLAHAVNFNSDAEADDQLRWEGFYQTPYVDQRPTGDLDDMAHAYMLTNRWHREAAAKKLLEEMQSTYGKKSRKFDYQKMGDVLEINNARVQPKGFPVLTRGTRPPE